MTRFRSYAAARVAAFNDHRQDIIGETSKPFDLANRKDGKLQTTVHIEKGFDAQAKVLRQVTINFYDAEGKRPVQTIYAARAKSQGAGLKEWTLFDGQLTDLTTGAVSKFDHAADTIGLQKTPENMAFLQRDPETLNFHDLRRQIAELKSGERQRQRRRSQCRSRPLVQSLAAFLVPDFCTGRRTAWDAPAALGQSQRLCLGAADHAGLLCDLHKHEQHRDWRGHSADFGGVAAEHFRVRGRLGADLESGELRWVK